MRIVLSLLNKTSSSYKKAFDSLCKTPDQLANGFPPKDTTLLGIVMPIRDLQSEYLQPIITQYFIDNKSEIWLLFLIAHSKR